MKITHSNGSETDTDKLDDVSAELLEKCHELMIWCSEHKIPIYAKYINPYHSIIGGFNSTCTAKESQELFGEIIRHIEQLSGQKIVFIEPPDTKDDLFPPQENE